MIQKNKLLNFEGTVIYQNDEWFKFSLDSVLLANFVTLRLSDKKIMDLCTGNAPIPMLLSYKTKACIYGIELQKEIFDLGMKSIIDSNMSGRITLINDNIKNVYSKFSSDMFDVVLCNPPYFKVNDNSYLTENKIKCIARHEIEVLLDDVFAASRYLLRNGGTFAMVHRPDRFVEIIDKMRKYGLEPKKVQFVYPKSDLAANMLLIEGVKNGKGGLKVLPPLVVHNNDGSYKDYIKNYFQN
jgi:tRNA1(Val) A37 N6-methylase TrmN6